MSIASLVAVSGSSYQIGLSHGCKLAPLVRANLTSFWRALQQGPNALRVDRDWLLGKAREEQGLLPARYVEEIAGMAEGSELPFADLLAYNLYGDWVFSDGCTVMMAIGQAGHEGNTLFMKNSDQVGNEDMVGPNFSGHKEVYVIQVIDQDEGHRIIGVSAAGRTGIKVGANNKGVATGSNISRTIELRDRRVDISQVRASDRTQLMRQGLEKESAAEAAHLVSGLLLTNPTSTPGNIEFADSEEGIIIEGSYVYQGLEIVRDTVAARANRFQLFEDRNQPEDVSSVCRYQRCMHLLRSNEGQLTLEKMTEFSRDHANGPGPNSICRHGQDYREETSLGAAAIEINGDDPTQTRIAMALGKPCHAWRADEGNITIRMDTECEEIPEGFFDGGVWKRFYSEEPQLP